MFQIAVQNDEFKTVSIHVSVGTLESVRFALIDRRDLCLSRGEVGSVVGLTHVIALLSESLGKCEQDDLMAALTG